MKTNEAAILTAARDYCEKWNAHLAGMADDNAVDSAFNALMEAINDAYNPQDTTP